MTYITLFFYLFVILVLLCYYMLPVRHRWVALLLGNAAFYMLFYKTGWWIFLATILLSYGGGWLLTRVTGKKKKMIFWLTVISVIVPWAGCKVMSGGFSVIVPLGISFYTLQIISYLADIYQGRCAAQTNLFKYTLYISFFPQIMQGPIPRYEQLGDQLLTGHLFDEEKFTKGFYLIIWGFFLKLVIADKAAVIVNTVFDNFPAYSGFYIWVAAILYSIQLYTDFLSCTTLAQGVSLLFGIELADNFKRPYFAVSIKDFWRRWHISLSSWLRDYIYIPLGGSRKGKIRKWVNLLLTFAVSGLWHGSGIKFLAWGILHAFYQILGEVLQPLKEKAGQLLKLPGETEAAVWAKRIITFGLTTIAWIIFRARTLAGGLSMIKHMFTDLNPWILFNDRLLTLGLEWKECLILVLAIILLGRISSLQEKGMDICAAIMQKKLALRWILCITAILGIMLFGTYGYGFDAQDFIYRGF